MLRTETGHASARESIIAAALDAVARDLTLLDPADLICHIKNGQFSNIGSLVGSSIELSFTAGTLRFGNGASIDVSWHQPPVITLDMEFNFNAVHAYFRLLIGGRTQRVVLDFIRFEDPNRTPLQNTECLSEAIMKARSCGSTGMM
jgi:hypothetical protein